jgi:hypothetical protein
MANLLPHMRRVVVVVVLSDDTAGGYGAGSMQMNCLRSSVCRPLCNHQWIVLVRLEEEEARCCRHGEAVEEALVMTCPTRLGGDEFVILHRRGQHVLQPRSAAKMKKRTTTCSDWLTRRAMTFACLTASHKFGGGCDDLSYCAFIPPITSKVRG